MIYKIEHNSDFDYLYGDFGFMILFLIGLFLYGLIENIFLVPLLIFIFSTLLTLIVLFLSIAHILKRKFIYFNTIENRVQYRNHFGKIKYLKINETDFKYKIIVDNATQFIFQISLLNRKGKKLFKMWNTEMKFTSLNSKIILNMLIDKVGFMLIN